MVFINIMKKKVVHFIHGLNTGGAETLVKDYAIGLDKNKYNVSILCYEHRDSPYEDILKKQGIKIIYACDNIRFWNKKGIIPKIINHYQLYFVIRKNLRMLNPDILHTHLPVNNFVKFAHLRKNIKLFHTVHNEPQKIWFDGDSQGKKDFRAAKWLVKHHDQRMIVLHDDMRKEVDKLFQVSDSIVLNNGIPFSKFENSKSKAEMRNELGIPKDSFVIGHVGRFSEQKNHIFLTKIFREIYTRDKNTFLLMAGAGEEKNKIKSIMDNSPMKDSYLILSNRSDVADLMQAMDVFVFPSKYEGLGIVLIEAQKSGLPCFASDIIPVYAKVTNLVNFYSLNIDEKEWAKEILKFRNMEYRNEFIKQSGEVPSEWEMKNVINKLEQIYEGVI